MKRNPVIVNKIVRHPASDVETSRLIRKKLGAFFTPDVYAKISTKYLRNAISRVPKGYDYIILDRCAGTGNLEKFLTDEELSHCVLNTYGRAEWMILKGLYGSRARYIVPHANASEEAEEDDEDENGDALAEEFDKLISCYLKKERKKANDKLIVIGLENPPYREPRAIATQSGKAHSQSSWVKEQMKKEKLGAATNDLANQFIWSMTKKYADHYILFAPLKYWKSQYLFDGSFNEGYLCNRKFFHASEAAISLISWTADGSDNDFLNMDSDLGPRKIKKLNHGASTLLPDAKNRRVDNPFAELVLYNGTPCYLNGQLINIVRNKDTEGRVRGLNKINILQLLPLWVANCFKARDYTEKDIIMKSGGFVV